ncbi:MAG: xanthine dehydrogenase family protein molybdopterin-binding subunit, partial [Rhodospirillaceae bacterium]|nr:xanthine dehydrogenase family protein molybdopterin-binding subunit [Rhodospirillaceae bacterium]
MNTRQIGRRLPRKEDQRLLTGAGRFVDDLRFEGELHAAFLRAPHAHARIEAVETTEAMAMPGVSGVFTAEDLARDAVRDIPAMFLPADKRGQKPFAPAQPVLARGHVRHVGEAVAMVVAESAAQALDAAERIAVRFTPLPAAVDTETAEAADTPAAWPDAPGNLCYVHEIGDAAATDAAFAGAAHIVARRIVNNRLIIHSIEPRAVIATPPDAEGRLAIYTNGQMPHRIRDKSAEILGLPVERLRCVIGDVGGAFGMKNMIYQETLAVLWAARRLGRPVRWPGSNGEGFVTDSQARDHVSDAALALDAEGRILGFRTVNRANLGAYATNMGALAPVAGIPASCGPYRIPAAHVEVRAVLTNTVRTDVFRGAGRPEATNLIERLMEAAAEELDIDRVELRRRNMIGPADLPHATPTGLVYDSGDFPATLDRAGEVADIAGFAARRAESEARGRLRGLGIVPYIEANGGAGIAEPTEIRVEPGGGVTVLSGMMANGQGHETAFAQIVADRFGLDPDEVEIVQGDTDRVKQGMGTAGSRSLVLDGGAMHLAMEKLVDLARPIASHLLEAAAADLAFEGGGFTIAGTDRRIAMREVFRAAHDPARLPPGQVPGLEAGAVFKPERPAHPNGCHVAEVEVDPDTGRVRVLRHSCVQDVGLVINPTIVEGQIHGGVAHGLGQALLEDARYDGDGQLLSGSLMDYCLPRAADMPDISINLEGTPCPSNPLGVKGAGESGAMPSPPAITVALLDALAPLGVRDIDMPATPQAVWR